MCNSLKWRLPWGDAKFCAVMCVEPPLYGVCFEFGASMLCACLPGSSFLFWAAPAIPRWHVAVARREKVQVFTLEARTGKPKQDTKEAPSQRTASQNRARKKPPVREAPSQRTASQNRARKKSPVREAPSQRTKPEQGTKKAPSQERDGREPFRGVKKAPPMIITKITTIAITIVVI